VANRNLFVLFQLEVLCGFRILVSSSFDYGEARRRKLLDSV